MMGRLGSGAVLAAAAWLALGASIDRCGSIQPMSATAQGSLTPPAGQPRATAPGGLRGRVIRSHRRHRAPHRRR